MKENATEFFFVENLADGKKGEILEDEFQFNSWLSDIPLVEKKRIISLSIQIRGRKAYYDWEFEEVSKQLLHTEYKMIEDAPLFDLDVLPELATPLSEAILTSFSSELKRKKKTFINISRTEATSREFVSPFLSTAVEYVQDTSQVHLQLKAEEPLDGSRGFGMVDYMIENDGVVVVVNEVKKKDSDLSKGAAQNIMQMHSALEVSFLYLVLCNIKFVTSSSLGLVQEAQV